MQRFFFLISLVTTVITSLSAQEERIVFASNRSGNFDIYTMKADGSDVKQLTNHPARDAWPKWSPNGQKIIFCTERFGKNQIMLMNADGTGLKNISNNKENELDPVISPDGQQIVFINKSNGSYQLHVMDIDGTNRRRLTNSGSFCGRADWSPDGRKLVYLSREDGNFEVYRINADGTAKRKLTNMKTGAGSPSWSKHGYYILFHAHENEVDRLFRMKPDGSELTKLSKGGQSDFQGRWSGHYNKIVYTSYRDGNYELYRANMNSQFKVTEETRLTNNSAEDNMADWFVPREQLEKPVRLSPELPDNYRLALTSFRGGSADVFSMKPDGTAVTRHTDSDDANSFPRDAGDGKRLIFRRAPTEGGTVQQWLTVNMESGLIANYTTKSIVSDAIEETENDLGTHIAYAREVDGYRELFLYDKAREAHVPITQNRQQEVKAMIHRSWWSHDGKKLAFLSGEDYYNLYLRVYDVASGETQTVTPRGYMFSGVVWLKDNQSFVLNIAIRNKISYELWGINLDGSGLKQLTNNPGRGNVHPQLSPDGNWIAFESGRDTDDGEIYLMRPDGSKQTRITYHPSYEGRPAWVVLK